MEDQLAGTVRTVHRCPRLPASLLHRATRSSRGAGPLRQAPQGQARPRGAELAAAALAEEQVSPARADSFTQSKTLAISEMSMPSLATRSLKYPTAIRTALNMPTRELSTV